MRKNGFIILAAVASLAIAACGKEEPVGPASGGSDTIPTTDTIPVIDTIPTDTATTVPWYASLVGTRWYCHYDQIIITIHQEEDKYWDILDDSTFTITTFNMVINGYPLEDTTYATLRYTYNPDILEFTQISPGGETQVYTLDTLEKTLTYFVYPMTNPIVCHLIEE